MILALPVLVFLIVLIVDLSRLTWIKTSVRAALSYAVKKAETDPRILADVHNLDSNEEDYRAFKEAREAVINEALQYRLRFLHSGNGIAFQDFIHLDQLTGGRIEQQTLPMGFLLPATAGLVQEDQGTRYISHTHICPRAENAETAHNQLSSSDGYGECPGRPRKDGEKISDLAFAYPFEVLANLKVKTFLMGNRPVSVTAAGYLTKGRAYYVPEPQETPYSYPPPPENTPTPSFTYTPAPSPTATPGVTQTPEPEQTPYVPPTQTPYYYPPTETPQPTATPAYIYTPVPSATPTVKPTKTPAATPTSAPTQTPTPDKCELAPVYKVNIDHATISQSQAGKPIVSGQYPSCLISKVLGPCQAASNEMHYIGSARFERYKAAADECVTSVLATGTVIQFGSPSVSIKKQAGFSGLNLNQFKVASFISYLDEDCTLIPYPGYTCYEFSAQSIVSPISLIWEDGVDIDDVLSFTQFPLDPNESGKWYDWRGSAKTPLLVYDPDLTGIVDSASQLFGNFTFGKRWEDGYHALRELDRNGDGKLEMSELNGLALWFDDNQDGVSQAGEVKSLKQSGVTTIYTTPDGKTEESMHIHARVGYARTVNGEKFIRPSVDWHSKSYGSRMEAIAEKTSRKPARSNNATAAGEPVVNPASVAETARAAAGAEGLPDLSGIWLWSTEETGGLPAAEQPQGAMTIVDTPDGISGHSFIEVPVHANPIGAASAVIKYTLSGIKTAGKDGRTTLSFQLSDATGSQTLSEAVLSADRKTLKGKSVLHIAPQNESGTVSYSWQARMME